MKRNLESSDFSSSSKRFRSSDHKALDAALLTWFKQARSNNLPVNGPILLEKAKSLATALGDESFTVSTGFIDRWKTRHGVMMKKVSGEAGSVAEEDVRPWLDAGLPLLLSQFKPEDVYNIDETGLFYKMTPDKSFTFKGEKCTGGKKAKERLTILVGAGMDGEKLPLLVIGKSKSPRCFSGVKSLPLEYSANPKAWMNGDLFHQWLQKWNRKLSGKNRHVLLVIDNCPAHPHDLQLTNITIKFLPPNTTAKLQPCDQGIIQSLKVYYRHQLLRNCLAAMENGKQLKITVLDAMQWLKIAWDRVTSETIKNCFRHCGFIAQSQSNDVDVQDIGPDINIDADEILDELRQHGLEVEASFQDFSTVDDYLDTTGTLTDEEIALLVESNHRDSEEPIANEEDYDEPVVCPTVSECYLALDIVKRFATCNGENQHLQALNCLDELIYTVKGTRKKQTEITDFFQ